MALSIPGSPYRHVCEVAASQDLRKPPPSSRPLAIEQDAGACEGDGEVLFNLFDNMTLMAIHSPLDT